MSRRLDWFKRTVFRATACAIALIVGSTLFTASIMYSKQGSGGLQKMLASLSGDTWIYLTFLPIVFCFGFALITAYELLKWVDAAFRGWWRKRTNSN